MRDGICLYFVSQVYVEKLNRVIKSASKVIGCELDDFDTLYTLNVKRKVHSLLKNETHPLYIEYERSARSGRLISKIARTERYLN